MTRLIFLKKISYFIIITILSISIITLIINNISIIKDLLLSLIAIITIYYSFNWKKELKKKIFIEKELLIKINLNKIKQLINTINPFLGYIGEKNDMLKKIYLIKKDISELFFDIKFLNEALELRIEEDLKNIETSINNITFIYKSEIENNKDYKEIKQIYYNELLNMNNSNKDKYSLEKYNKEFDKYWDINIKNIFNQINNFNL